MSPDVGPTGGSTNPDPRRRIAFRAVTAALLLLAVALLPVGLAARPHTPAGPPSAPLTVPPVPSVAPRPSSSNSSHLECDGVYWASWVWTNYSPSWCYGHDEPTMSFISTAANTGSNANFSFVLPADGRYPQGDLYATIWVGGVVYDLNSLNNQAYLELQFYPAPPTVTGPGSGAQDCLPDGSFNPTWNPGSNQWFACAIVWQVTSSENAAFAGPVDPIGSSAILVMNSHDQIFVNLSGTAQSPSQPWQIAVSDSTSHTSGEVSLRNGSLVLSPYYSTALAGNDLSWGADNPGAVAFAYEIGHALNPAIPKGGAYGACYPGDGACYSYWPGVWQSSGQLELSLPEVGLPGSQTYPAEIGLGSSAQGEAWINNTISGDQSTCTAPSWSPLTNCIYPWYIYRSQNYSFTFDANNETNDTHDYGNWYQFPALPAPNAVVFHPAPWGLLDSAITPTFAKVQFNRVGGTTTVPVGANGVADRQFLEGAYWFNVSYPGCTRSSTFLYLKTGAVYSTPVTLRCPGLFNVTFTESGLPSGTPWSVDLNGTTQSGGGSTITFYLVNGTQPYTVLTPVSGGTGVRYVASPNNGTVTVQGGAVAKSVPYSLQYELTASASPGTAAAVVTPTLLWTAPASVVQVGVAPGPSWAFAMWSGVGTGSYSGPQNPASVTLNGPVVEVAFLDFLYTISFTESGLPGGTAWTVHLNGQALNGTGATISASMANGSYSYTVSGPTGYTITPQTGSGSLTGGDVNVAIAFAKIVFAGLTATDLELIALVVGAIAVAVGANVAYALRKKRPPPPVVPEAPPPWVGPPR